MKKMTTRFFTLLILTSLSIYAFAEGGNKPWAAAGVHTNAFIENKGQFRLPKSSDLNGTVLYAYDAGSTRVFFTKTGVSYYFAQKSKKKEDIEKEEKFRNINDFLEKEKEEKAATVKTDEVSFSWAGGNANVQLIAEEETSGTFSYSFFSAGKEKNVSEIKGFKKLTYKNIYPNIDVEYVFHPESGLKYSLILRPGANAALVKMLYSNRPVLNANGEIQISTKFGNITDHAPLTFYADNKKSIIASEFVKGGKTVSFALGNYDNTRTIVIDPWTQTPSLPNSNKIWETETDASGNVYIYGGDSFMKLLKYNSTGTLQWTYVSPWDSANYWIGGFITDPSGNSYMTSGSNGEIKKITTGAGAVAWSNNPNGLTSYEYWSLAFNCDLTHLVVGGSRSTFAIPTPVLRGTITEINLSTGAQVSTKVVGYGATSSIPPNVQEVSSICSAPNGNYYYLTLDTVGSINTALSTINFKTQTSYNFDYYIPGYGLGTKQPISAIRASNSAFYTMNGTTIHKRDLNTGAVLATAAIPGGIQTTGFFGTKLNGCGGLDVDSCGNVYVGSGNAVVKYDANLNLITSASTTFAVYDVDVNINGEVAACGYSGGVGKIQTFNMSACRQQKYVCSVCALSANISAQTNVSCNGGNNGSATVNVTGASGSQTYQWLPSGGTGATANGLSAGTYTVNINDGGCATSKTVTISQPAAISLSTNSTAASCGMNNGTASVNASGGAGSFTYTWSPSGGNSATASNLGANSYTVTVKDANNCTNTAVVNITSTNGPTATPTVLQNVSCNGGTDGSASVSIHGGSPSYTVTWSNSTVDSVLSNVPSGVYTYTVVDAGNCTTTNSVSISQPGPISTTVATSPSGCSGATGSATVTAAGGAGVYTYTWSDGQTSSIASGLAPGQYTCTISDANKCNSDVIVNITCTTGINQVVSGKSVVVYPNPVQNDLSVTTKNIARSIQVFNVAGELLFETKPNDVTTSIDFGKFAQGIYFIKVQLSDNTTNNIKVIKQ